MSDAGSPCASSTSTQSRVPSGACSASAAVELPAAGQTSAARRHCPHTWTSQMGQSQAARFTRATTQKGVVAFAVRSACDVAPASRNRASSAGSRPAPDIRRTAFGAQPQAHAKSATRQTRRRESLMTPRLAYIRRRQQPVHDRKVGSSRATARIVKHNRLQQP